LKYNNDDHLPSDYFLERAKDRVERLNQALNNGENVYNELKEAEEELDELEEFGRGDF
jgi:hypothetical protein